MSAGHNTFSPTLGGWPRRRRNLRMDLWLICKLMGSIGDFKWIVFTVGLGYRQLDALHAITWPCCGARWLSFPRSLTLMIWVLDVGRAELMLSNQNRLRRKLLHRIAWLWEVTEKFLLMNPNQRKAFWKSKSDISLNFSKGQKGFLQYTLYLQYTL